jgi:hypothetical protein
LLWSMPSANFAISISVRNFITTNLMG